MFYELVKKLLKNNYNLSETKLIVLGNQKSGTTAIAKLLALSTNQSILLDTSLLWQPHLSKLLKSKGNLNKVIDSNKRFFSRAIIKEPNLTFFIDELLEIYPSTTQYVFIVRDPRNNIRSLLNRVNIPGNLKSFDKTNFKLSIHEEVLFNKEVMNYSSTNYIEQLAERWNLTFSHYEKNKSNITLVKYEDFIQNKVLFIESLASSLSLNPKIDITTKIDIQYQPKGDQNIHWIDFYGKQNLNIIEQTCAHFMQKLNYV